MTSLVSGEAVPLDLSRAGVGSRIVAGALDLTIQLLALIAIIVADAALLSGDSAIVTALVLIEVVAVFGGYPTLMEWLTRGRTLGKMAMGLRVVRDDGGPIGFRQSLTRGMSSLLLEKPGLIFPIGTAAGIATMAFSSSNKRIGDLMAGTFVLAERAGNARSLQPVRYEVAYPLQGWASVLDLSRVDDQLAMGIRQFLQRAAQLSPAAQTALGEQFRHRLEAVIAPPPPPGVPTPVLLTTVLAERRRRAEQRSTAQRSYPQPPPRLQANSGPPSGPGSAAPPIGPGSAARPIGTGSAARPIGPDSAVPPGGFVPPS